MIGYENLADVLADVEDLGQAQAAIVRERVIRGAMAQTGEGRTTVTDMIDAMESVGQEDVLDLTDGEPTTLVDALRRYVDELEKLPEDYPLTVSEVASNLATIRNYPWLDEEALISLHDPHYGLALHITEGENRDLEIRMGSNRCLVHTVDWEDAGSGGQRAAEEVARAVYRATLARVIPDRDHHVDLNGLDRAALMAWLDRPGGSLSLGRLTLNAGGPGGVIVKTRPFSYQSTRDKSWQK